VPRVTIHIPTDDRFAPLDATMLLAAVAYPRERRKALRFYNAGCCWYTERARPVDKKTARNIARSNPPYRKRDVENCLSRGFRRIYARRLHAAGIALTLLSSNKTPGFSLNKALIYLGSQLKSSAAANNLDSLLSQSKRDIWRESAPVLHLSLALLEVLVARHLENKVGFNTRLVDLILRPDWLPGCLAQAELYRPLVGARFNIPESTAIQILPE